MRQRIDRRMIDADDGNRCAALGADEVHAGQVLPETRSTTMAIP
jgi:hypothetical protein